jgi:hypothetical protein
MINFKPISDFQRIVSLNPPTTDAGVIRPSHRDDGPHRIGAIVIPIDGVLSMAILGIEPECKMQLAPFAIDNTIELWGAPEELGDWVVELTLGDTSKGSLAHVTSQRISRALN